MTASLPFRAVAPRPLLAAAVLLVALAGTPAPALATPLDFIPVGDPLEDELRILDVLGPSDSLRHLAMRPLQVMELPALDGDPPSSAAGIAMRRLRRALARDRENPFTAPGTTPRLLQLTYPDRQRLAQGYQARGLDDAVRPAGHDAAPRSRSPEPAPETRRRKLLER